MNRFLSAVVVFSMVGCGSGTEEPTPPTGGPTTLQTEDITVGTGDTARNGDTLTVHYIGSFLDGRVFQSSYGGQPYTFRLGAGAVIAGWDQGIPGMRVGGKRRLTIPSSLAYGSQGSPPTIPPNTPIRFEVELLSLTR